MKYTQKSLQKKYSQINLHYAAITNKNLTEVKNIVEAGIAPDAHTICAAVFFQIPFEIIDYLFENIDDWDKFTPDLQAETLNSTRMHGNTELAEYLIVNQSFNPFESTTPYEYYFTPYERVKYNHDEVFIKIYEKYEPSILGNEIQTIFKNSDY